MRKMGLFLVTVATILSLAACKKDVKTEEETTPKKEVTKEETKSDSQESGNPVDPDEDYRLTSYAVVLGEYRKAMQEQWSFEQLTQNDISELSLLAYGEDSPNKVGYAFLDFNNDGVDELIMGAVGEDDPYEFAIYDMYALVNGDETHVFSSHERSRYYLNTLTEVGEDYALCFYGSNGATSGEFKNMNWDGSRLVVYQAVLHDDSAQNPWMMGYEQNGEVVYSEVIELGLGQDIIDAALGGRIHPKYTLFQ